MNDHNPNQPPPMEGDLNDRRISQLYAELREADVQDAPPFQVLITSPTSAANHAGKRALPPTRTARWALAATLLAGATAVFLVKLAFVGPEPPAPTGATSKDWWSAPSDCLLGSSAAFGSLGNWRSPTDSLYDFAPTNHDT